MFGVELLLSSWAVTALIGLVTILLLYRFSIRNHGYWKERGVPFHEPLPFVGSMLDFLKKPLHEIEMERCFKYGPVYGHYEGNTPLLSVADPALLRDILLKDFPAFSSRRSFNTDNVVLNCMLPMMKGDEEWKRIRTIVSPTFSTGKIKRMLSILNESSRALLHNVENLSKDGKSMDAKRMYGAFTMDVIASAAFSTKIDSHNDPDNQFVTTAKKAFTQEFTFRFFLFLVIPRLTKFLGIEILPTRVMDFFKNATLEIMEERKRTGQTRNDFLQLLMDTAKEKDESDDKAADPTGDIATNYGVPEDINPHIFKAVTAKNLSLDELVAQGVIFFIAGYEPTSLTLSLASFALATNQDVQDKLRTEVDRVLNAHKGEVTYEGIQSMKYLDNVISETMRLYAPPNRLERVAEMDYKLGNTGITIPKGMVVTIPIYGIHKDPKIYPDPEKFDPDRFTPEEIAKRDPYTYLPFGAGPRNCVAMRFALMEVKVCLAHVIANFVIKTCPETKIPLQFNKGQNVQPVGIILNMETRADSPLKK